MRLSPGSSVGCSRWRLWMTRAAGIGGKALEGVWRRGRQVDDLIVAGRRRVRGRRGQRRDRRRRLAAGQLRRLTVTFRRFRFRNTILFGGSGRGRPRRRPSGRVGAFFFFFLCPSCRPSRPRSLFLFLVPLVLVNFSLELYCKRRLFLESGQQLVYLCFVFVALLNVVSVQFVLVSIF